jgi:cobalt-precorrin 5A hydrolase
MLPLEIHPIPAKKTAIAVWAVTPGGGRLAAFIAERLPHAVLHLSASASSAVGNARRFPRLSDAVARRFHDYSGHIFIMSTGIVIRMIAPLIRSKTTDPAVVAVDEAGRHAISLLSGHIGGANALARRVAGLIGAAPVITTATDATGAPAIDVIATETGLFIENPDAIKAVNMALLTRSDLPIHDPYNLIRSMLPPSESPFSPHQEGPGVYVDDLLVDLLPRILILRPRWLAAGVGCNRNTPAHEIQSLLMDALAAHQLSPAILERIASIDAKRDETGLLRLGEDLELPIDFFDPGRLDRVEGIQTPSAMAAKHMGTKSVCEAAAILATGNGTLIVPKQRTRNVTVAIARRHCLSSASAPGASTIYPKGRDRS